ncbi:Single-stranded DNA-binding protein [Pedobacter sp. Bi27]|uniref:single-stranded DNA-binding protein n=1 Tax=Pedobacter sp. Bi27 TaxID=2822351 RepID=UPI001DF93790|nr:single-stranded DNA-binding protein [Pedobacter sp. Bi27]CAH0278532.1 Single-stranded DNA-binding protein [Pedobacter sp. Bi27]
MEITGRLTADAVTRMVSGDRKVTGFRLVVNDSYMSGGEKKEVATFVECSYWLGTGIAPYLKKGGVVQVCGRIGVNAWISNDGEAKASITMHVSDIKMFSASAPASATAPTSGSRPLMVVDKGDENGDLPF